MYKIEIIAKDRLHSVMPLIKLLNPDTDDKILQERFDQIKQTNYECVGVYDQEKLVGICGLWILNKFYVGKHIEPDNVIIHPDYRGKHIGELMMNWIFEYAKTQGCIASELNCYVQNEKGIKFWESQGYKILGYHFQKQL